MSCIGGVPVFRMVYLTICCVLLKDMTGGHVLLEGIYSKRTSCFFIVLDVLLGYMFYRRAYLT